jgi:peptide chain release factor 3
MSQLKREIERRRTFAIISHPDAGKTTLTEKFLLYGGAIQSAGSVKGKQSDKHAVSDWMDLEKQRGISITSSVLQFEYDGYCINILDTPGHQDFSEDTYRTLMAADSAVMVIDAAKGIEPQTRKLFKVCAMRDIPIFTFINKMDREARDPFDLLDELEKEFGIGTYPMNWPIGCGQSFKGVYDRDKKSILSFGDSHRGRERIHGIDCDITDTAKLDELIGEYQRAELVEQVELLDGASFDFDIEAVRHGKLSPVFFGSALNNFGIEPFLEHFLKMTTSPLPRVAEGVTVDPFDEDFTEFVFKPVE